MAAPGDDDTTLTLVQTENPSLQRAATAIRWLTTSAPESRLLTGARLVLGRAETAELRIESAAVSRHHAELTRQGPVFAIRDLESRNGTFLNGRRIQHGALSEGDVLRLGDAVGVIARVDPALVDEAPVELAGALFGPDLSGLLSQIRRLAPSDLPVVLMGETGVGKESAARAVHLLSGRSGPFHALNCGALPANLAEAELFGYRKGAFTGAEQPAVGHLRAAHGGTLLLDELAELSPSIQVKLLRALQEKQVMPLGETRAVSFDVRVVVACQQSLESLVQQRRIRQDLAARLLGATLELPPLRARRSDVGYLFGYFARSVSGGRPPRLDAKLLERLLLYSWPNNVRELELLARRLVVVHGHEPLLKQSVLPAAFGRSDDPEIEDAKPSTPPLEDRNEHDLRALKAALSANQGNVSRAAAMAGISRQRAYRLMAARDEELSMQTQETLVEGDGERGSDV